MTNAYDNEIQRFRETFGQFRDKKIVLYGIGRFTATLLPGICDYNVVGLMDRNPENIGNIRHGLPIISLDEAESKADAIIINTSPIYWHTIYRRIKSASIPIFYLDGTKAGEKVFDESKKIFFGKSKENAIKAIDLHEIITFDFFDTLMLRKCWDKNDVFNLVGLWGRELLPPGTDFTEVRLTSAAKLKGTYATISEIYEEVGKILDLSNEVQNQLMEIEFSVEKMLLYPRHDVFDLLSYAISEGKSVYIISDMYMPSSFMKMKLKECGINLPEGHIIVSCESKANKSDGTLWKKFLNDHYGKSILHMGDDEQADDVIPAGYGIDTYSIAGVNFLADACGLTDLTSKACSLFASLLLGHVMGILLNSPFTLKNTGAKLQVRDRHAMGYAVLGPVIVTYLIWLEQMRVSDHIRRLYFFSRDGYFLQRNYMYMKKILKNSDSMDGRYLCVSRFVSLLVASEKNDNYENMLLLPFSAEPKNFLRKRFTIDIDCQGPLPDDNDENLYKYRAFKKHEQNIREKAYVVRCDYQAYLDKQDIKDGDALVDLSYRGTNQHHLQEFMGKKLPCYYLVADISNGNPYAKNQQMFACAQDEDDLTALQSDVYKYQLAVESFLTAPYGMILRVFSDGTLQCDKPKKNQKYFKEKEQINEGIKELLKDILDIYDKNINFVKLDISFMMKLYGELMRDKADFSKDAVDSFYYDNGMFHDEENPVFG